ncbi:hypothetical protein GOBAR_DD02810 [Gossypium barbadense]|nr:hypothetical protein GOBAR_DD02810 [Gossypium barbadense]
MALNLVLAKLTRALLLLSHSCEVYASSPEGYSRELSLQTSSIPAMSSADYACRRTFFFQVGFIRIGGPDPIGHLGYRLPNPNKI